MFSLSPVFLTPNAGTLSIFSKPKRSDPFFSVRRGDLRPITMHDTLHRMFHQITITSYHYFSGFGDQPYRAVKFPGHAISYSRASPTAGGALESSLPNAPKRPWTQECQFPEQYQGSPGSPGRARGTQSQPRESPDVSQAQTLLRLGEARKRDSDMTDGLC
jgi:hypothetical protein